jgi:aminopeptidase-like protein
MLEAEVPAEEIKHLVDSIFPFDYSIAGEANDQAAIELRRHLDFSLHSYPTGMLLNGWRIPPAWEFNYFELYKNSELLFRTTDGSFFVARNSPSVDLTLSFNELMSRTNRSLSGYGNDLVYDWRNLYHNSVPDWQISLSEDFINKLDKDASYRVVIDTKFYDSQMHVLTFDTHPESNRTLIINAHNCHPFQANDDVSGIVASILIAQRWKQFSNFNLNVRLIIAPEIYGPLFYLNQFDQPDCIGALLLKGIGNRNHLKIQSSLDPTSDLDRIFWKVLEDLKVEVTRHAFRSYYGNDEIVFENPPYCIPSITLTRIPYPEYHTSSDTPDIIDESSIDEVVQITLQALEGLAMNCSYSWKIDGLQKLSEPGLDLYKPVPAQGIHELGGSPTGRKWNILMNSLPGLISKGYNALSLSERFDLPLLEVIRYLLKWESSGFIEKSRVSFKK